MPAAGSRKVEIGRDQLHYMHYVEGLSQAQMAEHLGVSQATVSRLMKEHGVRARQGTAARNRAIRRQWYSKPVLEHYYVIEGMSATDLADLAGVAVSTITRWLREFGIAQRSPGELISRGKKLANRRTNARFAK